MSRSTAIAKVISKVMNPFLISLATLLLAIWSESGDVRMSFIWILIILLFIAILPLTYVYIRTSRVGSEVRYRRDTVLFFREHRKEISTIAIICALPCILLLVFLQAPPLLVATVVVLLVTSLAVGLVGVFYRASLHLALITTLVILVVLIWGRAVLPVLLAIPLIGWARYTLHQHSPGQLVAGFALSVVIGIATFWLFGLLGNVIL